MQVGDQCLVRKAATIREIHRGRIGRLASGKNRAGYYSIEFSDGSQIKFLSKEIELVTTPSALSKIYEAFFFQ